MIEDTIEWRRKNRKIRGEEEGKSRSRTWNSSSPFDWLQRWSLNRLERGKNKFPISSKVVCKRKKKREREEFLQVSNLEFVSAWTNRVRERLEGGGGGRVKNKSPRVGRNVRSFPCGRGKNREKFGRGRIIYIYARKSKKEENLFESVFPTFLWMDESLRNGIGRAISLGRTIFLFF